MDEKKTDEMFCNMVHQKLFEDLVRLNVNDHTETKNDLTYLSWAWAWQKFKEKCPDATYEIKKFADKDGLMKPYIEDDVLGLMVFTSVTANGLTYEMWLPVMDNANRAMKKQSYSYQTRGGERTVEAATMFDVNKTIMRCLVKNIAMFGLGLYIYAGEDLPEENIPKCTQAQVEEMRALNVNEVNVCKKFKVLRLEDLDTRAAEYVISTKKKAQEE